MREETTTEAESSLGCLSDIFLLFVSISEEDPFCRGKKKKERKSHKHRKESNVSNIRSRHAWRLDGEKAFLGQIPSPRHRFKA